MLMNAKCQDSWFTGSAHAALFCSTQLICLMADHWYLASMTLPVLLCSLLIQYLVHLNASQLKHPDEFLHLLQTPMPLVLILWIAAWYSSGSSSSFRQSFSCRNPMASFWSSFSSWPLSNLLFAIFKCFCMASNACKAWQFHGLHDAKMQCLDAKPYPQTVHAHVLLTLLLELG